MRLDLSAIAFGLLLFFGSAQNWAQEQGKDTQTKPSAGTVDSSSTEKSPAKFSDEQVAAEFKRLTGIWRPKSALMAGKNLPFEVGEENHLELTGNRFKSMAHGHESSGTIALNLTNEPKAMDITFNDGELAGKTLKCVYKFEDDNLHVAYSTAFDDVRPTKIESNQDNKLLLIIYEHPDIPSKPDGQLPATAETPRDK